jgi:phage-related protein
MNNNLVHNCDFNFLFNLDLGLGPLLEIFAAIPNAIKKAKNAAASILSYLIRDFMKGIFLALKALQEGLSFDMTGKICLTINRIKQLIADVQDVVNFIAQVIENIMTIVYFIQDVQALIKWILGLPQELINIVIGCLNQFKSTLNSAVNQIKSVPGQVQSTVQGTINSITSTVTTSFQNTVDALNSGISSQSAGLDPTLSSALTATDPTALGTVLVSSISNNNDSQLSMIKAQPQNNVPSSNGTSTSTSTT